MTEDRIRCLLGMVGTDVHSKGLRILAHLLRDEGFEVIYAGEHNTVDSLVSAAIQEDAHVVGLSFSSTAYVDYTRQIVEAMNERGIGDVPVMIGGQIHPDDHEALRKIGVSGIFGPGFAMQDVFSFVRRAGGIQRQESAARPVVR